MAIAIAPNFGSDDDDGLSAEVMKIINKKVAAYNSKKSNAKTPAQYHAGLVLQGQTRQAEIKAKCRGIAQYDVDQIVIENVGKAGLGAVHNAITHWNELKLVHSEARADKAETLFEHEQDARKQMSTVFEGLQEFMGKMMERVERLAISGPTQPLIADETNETKKPH